MSPTRIEPFVPLSIGSGPSPRAEQSHITVLSGGVETQPFKPLKAGVEIPPASTTSGGAVTHCEPRISLLRNGDVVTGIHIECSCGQVIDLACIYPEGGNS